MTKRETFVTLLTLLGETFGCAVTEALLDAYWLVLEELSEFELKTATKRALAACRFMPKPADLLTFAGRATTAQHAAEAWEAVCKAMRDHDYTASVDFGPLVNAVVRNIGGWQYLCDCSVLDLVWRRKDFERLYEDFVSKPTETLHGQPLLGAFGGPAVRIAIGGALPQRQIEAPKSKEATEVRDHIRKLADSKAAQ